MSKQTGASIKEARTAAGLSQKALAEKVDGLSASSLGKAERGEKELTPEQLTAIAEATGVAPETLMEAPEEKALSDEELVELLKSADPETKNAAVSVLKGEKPQGGDIMSMFAGMMGGADGEGSEGDSSEQAKAYFANMMGGNGEGGGNPMAGMMSMFGGMMGGGAGGEGGEGAEGGEGGENPMAGMMNMFGGMMGGGEGAEGGENPMAGMMNMFGGMMGGGEGAEGGENPMAGMMNMFGGMMGGAAGGDQENAEAVEEAPAEEKPAKKSKK